MHYSISISFTFPIELWKFTSEHATICQDMEQYAKNEQQC